MSEFVVPKDIAEKLGETLFQGDKAAAVAATQEALASGVAFARIDAGR
jgi:predicted aspartyl protease